MKVADELAALVLPLLPYSDIPTGTDAERIAEAILARYQVRAWPKGHVRESIDPRRDIEPHGPVQCQKCGNPVARYELSERAGDLIVTYSSFGVPKTDCID